MVLGMSLATFTLVHVLISLAGIGSGFIVLYGLLSSRRFDSWTAIFLATTVLTSVTGFLFPVEHLLPSHIVGIVSLVVLAIAILARYALRLAHAWRWIYVVCAVLALYLNVFGLGRSIVHENTGRARPGAHSEGTALPGGSVDGHGNLYRARHVVGEEISGDAGVHMID